MDSESDDFDLTRAIALSTGQPDPLQPGGADNAIVIIDSSSETGDDLIIVPGPSALYSHIPKLSSVVADDSNTARSVCHAVGTTKLDTQNSAISPLERRKLETERLARVERKRKASEISDEQPPHQRGEKQLHGTTTAEGDSTILQYPNGVVKKTWLRNHARHGDDVKLEEVLQTDTLQMAICSSFQWDMQWFLGKLKSNTKITLILHAKEDEIKLNYRHAMAPLPNVRLCFPHMGGQINCMHSKLMVLSHGHFLRVVIPTANLVRFDWGETGTMENMVFMVDVPRINAPESARMTAFSEELLYFLKAQGIEKSLLDSIKKFDFSATAQYRFVHTIGGAHSGQEWERTGHCGLSKAIKELQLSTTDTVRVHFVTSSVGSLNIDFIKMIYQACRGTNALVEYNVKNSKKHASESLTTQDSNVNNTVVKENFRLYFPTQATVRQSTEGFAGTVCMSESYWANPKFPREIMRDCQSIRSGCLMHNKLMYVTRPDGKAWAYLGSANLSESAWGTRLVKDKSTKGPKMNCRNWECGVVITVATMRPGPLGDDLMEFKNRIPVPMRVPGPLYGNHKPWFFMAAA